MRIDLKDFAARNKRSIASLVQCYNYKSKSDVYTYIYIYIHTEYYAYTFWYLPKNIVKPCITSGNFEFYFGTPKSAVETRITKTRNGIARLCLNTHVETLIED